MFLPNIVLNMVFLRNQSGEVGQIWTNISLKGQRDRASIH